MWGSQEGAQWDGLSHVGYPPADAFYNGVKRDDIKDGPDGKLGIDKWKDRIAGRGVLIDVFKYRQDAGNPLNPFRLAAFLDQLPHVATAVAVRQ